MSTPLHITLSNVYSTLDRYDEGLDKAMTCAYPNYWFSPRFRSGEWDGRWHALNFASLKFPTGLLFIAQEYCEEKGIPLTISDNRIRPKELPPPLTDPNILQGIVLRDYQILAVNKALAATRGILELPTASGKTEIAAAIILHSHLTTLYMVNACDLLYQTADRLKLRFGNPQAVGLIGDGVCCLDLPVTVATVQSLNNLLKNAPATAKRFLSNFSLLIQDECHHSSSLSFVVPALFMHNAFYRIGLSGTALRRDVLSNRKAMSVLGPSIFSLKSTELVTQGYLSDLEVRVIETTVSYDYSSWANAYEEGIVQNESRNQQIVTVAEAALAAGKRVMILVKHISHGKVLSALLKAPVMFLCGADNSAVRGQLKLDFNQHGDWILIASPIFDEGVDLPEITVLINASGGKSEWKTIQKVGRGLRKKASGEKLVVYDFADHGRFLENHSANRVGIYEREGFTVIREGGENGQF